MSQLSHAEDASFSHEGEDSVTATEGEWVRAHPSYTKIRLIQVVGFFITLVGVFAALTVMFEMMRSSGVLPKTTWLPALTGAIAAVLVVWGIWWAALLPRRTRALGYSLRPKQGTLPPAYLPQAYHQLDRPARGFVPELSILDLLFNMGPESPLILQASYHPYPHE